MTLKGIAHINFTVSNFERSFPFYKQLFAHLGLKEMINADGYYYCVGKRTAIGIQACSEENTDLPFDQGRAGLHHYCLSLESRDDIDALASFVKNIGARIVRKPAAQDDWFPGMYSFLFEDPDGIRIEANHIPKRS
ncbi:VOC family protein [Parvibaculaceae bacterium PLY_AMNH_Bact1]|nr:VOC family protein [Parvibaculaceae bacterium PLY_AMNH_Bact1]